MPGTIDLSPTRTSSSAPPVNGRLPSILTDLCIVLLAAVAPVYWLVSDSLILGHDVFFHLLRVQALDEALRSGVFYPRWFEGFAYGYGYPVLHYYAPLFYYLAEAVHLVGFSFSASANVAILLSRACGGFAMYLLVVRLLHMRSAGLLSAAAFLFAPYQLTDLFLRAAWPEVMAFNLLPLVCLALDAVIERLSMRRVSLLAFSLAALLLTHQTTFIPSAAFLTAFGLIRIVGRALSGTSSRRASLVVLSLLSTASLALALSAFFWYPAFTSRAYVGLQPDADAFDSFADHLQPLPQLVQHTMSFSHAYPESVRLGLVSSFASLAGLLAALLVARRRRWTMLAVGMAWVASALLLTEPSRPIWQALPFVTMMQFPFRMLMYVETAAAMLVGALAILPWRRVSLVASVIAAGAVAASSLWSLQPWIVELPRGYPNDASYARHELDHRYPQIGTTVPAQFLPVWVQALPESLGQSRATEVGSASQDLNASLSASLSRGADLDLTVDAREPFLLRYRRFYFPDWRAVVNGHEQQIGPDGRRGIIAVPLAAGTSTVQLKSGHATDWRIAEAISVVAFALVLVMMLGGRVLGRGPVFVLRGIGAGLVVVSLFGLAILSGIAPSGRAAQQWQPSSIRYDSGLDLAGWTHRIDEAASRSSIRFEMLWFARRDLTIDQEVVIRLLDRDGAITAEYSRQPRWGAEPTSTWERGELVRDVHELPIPPGAAARDYRVFAGWRQPGVEPELREIGRLIVTGPTSSPIAAVPEGFVRLEADAANGLSVLAYSAGPPGGGSLDTLEPGETIRLGLLIQARTEVTSDAAISAILAGPTGEKAVVRDTYPPQLHEFTGSWLRGESRVIWIDLPTAADIPDGLYRLAFELYDYRSGERIRLRRSAGDESTRVEVAALRLLSPPRAPRTELRAQLGDGIAIAGFDLEDVDAASQPDDIQVTLHWQVSTVPNRDYTVFIHLYDRAGKLIAQHDGPPLAGRLPTSSWRAGDAISDRHALKLGGIKPGEYRLVVGLYDPATGQRLRTVDGDGSLELRRFTLK